MRPIWQLVLTQTGGLEMADYDFSKPAPDRSHRVPLDSGSGAGSVALILAGVVILLVVLYAVFGGIPAENSNEATAPAVEETVPAVPTE